MLRSSPRLSVAAIAALSFFVGVFVGKYFFEPAERVIPAHYFDEMSLFTWKGWSGDLCFLLVPMTERARVRHDFWSKWEGRCGVANLKQALLALPREKSVQWSNSPSKFELPSESFCDQIVEFAKAEGVRLRLTPMLDTWFSDWQPQ